MTSIGEVTRAVRPGPVFIATIAATAAGGWLLWDTAPGRSGQSVAGALLLVLGGWTISLCLHEFGHAVTAFVFGDKNAELRGYLTLDPRKYAHPGLSLVLPLLFILIGGIGFPGGAVYVNTVGFTRHQRTVVSLAGPAANIICAALLLAVIGTRTISFETLNFWSALAMLAMLQITAAVLNLLPVPGFDGYGAIEPYLSDETRRSLEPVAPYGFLIVLLVMLFPPLNRLFFDLIYWLFSLSGVNSAWASWGWNLVLFWR